MNYFFMRHGQASWDAARDADRPLTHQGIVQLKAKLQRNAGRLQAVQHIVHSPYLRAVQSAEVAAEILGISTLIPDARWTPESDVTHALESLESLSFPSVLLVTHNPLVSRLVAVFCEGKQATPEPFDTATLVRVDADWPASGMGTLAWKD
ncbi:MAG: phosphohistidine phosphatase SixA [Pontibacterium sp.]